MCVGARWALFARCAREFHVTDYEMCRSGRMRCVVLLGLIACGDPGPASFGDPVDDPQLPPRGAVDLPAWLDAGFHSAWSCEATAHPPRPGSGHGPNRI